MSAALSDLGTQKGGLRICLPDSWRARRQSFGQNDRFMQSFAVLVPNRFRGRVSRTFAAV